MFAPPRPASAPAASCPWATVRRPVPWLGLCATAFLAQAACGHAPSSAMSAGNTNQPMSDGNDQDGNGGTTPVTTGNDTAPAASAGATRIVGRSAANQNILSWPASGLTFAFTGTMGNVSIPLVSGQAQLQTVVDGNVLASTTVTAPTTLHFGPLAAGNHQVRINKLTESRLGELRMGNVVLDGNLIVAAQPNRRIDFIGDSMTAGYGILGTTPSCTNSVTLEDASKSYAALTANALGAEPSLIAVAGKGLVRNDVSDQSSNPITMQTIALQLTGGDANTPYTFPAAQTPQAVVIALGTNDWEYTVSDANGNATPNRAVMDANTFAGALVSFVQGLQLRYSQVGASPHFVLCSSPMLNDTYPTSQDEQHTAHLTALQTAAAQLQPNATVVDFSAMTTAQATGCGNHPSLAVAQSMAALLTAHLQQALGW